MQKIKNFSPQQKLAMSWWSRKPYCDYDAIICDGAVRSGKTLAMSIGFVSWAMTCFQNGSFALCGKTITSLKRNVMTPLLELLGSLGFTCLERVSRNYVDISLSGRTNRFYLFGGRDESSAALIQGMTLCGVFLDEVALMPRSFVEQALARCSVTGSRLWFNCNPDNPNHWFYREWIRKTKEKHALYLHFTMADNPSLSKRVRQRYERMYSGAFYDRFVLGKWTAADGLVYPMFTPERHVVPSAPPCDRYWISCDYGTVNPSSFGLWGHCDGTWYRLEEYYYDARAEGERRTDEEHYAALEQLAAGLIGLSNMHGRVHLEKQQLRLLEANLMLAVRDTILIPAIQDVIIIHSLREIICSIVCCITKMVHFRMAESEFRCLMDV